MPISPLKDWSRHFECWDVSAITKITIKLQSSNWNELEIVLQIREVHNPHDSRNESQHSIPLGEELHYGANTASNRAQALLKTIVFIVA